MAGQVLFVVDVTPPFDRAGTARVFFCKVSVWRVLPLEMVLLEPFNERARLLGKEWQAVPLAARWNGKGRLDMADGNAIA